MAELVFLHGAADSGHVWEHQVAYFGRHHDVLALDLPGHGQRLEEQALTTIEEIAQEAIRAARAHDMAHPIFVGHSMGGATAMEIGLTEPSFPAALVLVGTGARLRIRPELIEEARLVAETAPAGQIVPRLVSLDSATSPSASDGVKDWIRQRFGEATGQAVHADFLATSGFDALDRIGALALPVLILAGEHDLWTPPKFQDYLLEKIPGARLVMLENAGHYPFAERPDEFNRELERFLAGVHSTGRETPARITSSDRSRVVS